MDWYPWGAAALERSRTEDRPIFLSIGYAACHWCHVMERESFENPEIAAYLNEHFVSIKVDREERPDIDEIYMNAVQMMTGAGGWPMTVFLTPELRPFFGGTYFPPRDAHGRIGFAELLRRVQGAWHGRRGELDVTAARMTEQLRQIAGGAADPGNGQAVGARERRRAVAELTGRFDGRHGGFGPAPKFPPDGGIGLLFREHERSGESMPLEMAERTLEAMASGGIYDHVGGGFARYSVDDRWLVPHFEKMLYNQALLVPLYIDAWRLTRKPLYRRVVEQTLDFVRRELTDGGGGFHSSLDADSEGHEGKFYVWSPQQVREVLGDDDGRLFCESYDITDGGNFEGRNIPNLLGGTLAELARRREISEEQLAGRLEPLRERLRLAREERVRPATDDKVLTAWNGLMISAFARAYQALGRDEDLLSARRAADFARAKLIRNERLLVTFRAGDARLNAYLDEHAFLGRGLLDLYEACFATGYLELSRTIARTMGERFGDSNGGFFFTSDDHESLLTRNRSLHDGALPSGAGVAVELLARLAVHLDDAEFRKLAAATLQAYGPLVERTPAAFSSLLAAADFCEGPIRQVTIAGRLDDPGTARLLETVRRRYLPRLVVGLAPCAPGEEPSALTAGKTRLDGKPAAYVCTGRTCRAPTSDPEELERLLVSDQ